MNKCLICGKEIKENHLLCKEHYNEIKNEYPFITYFELNELNLFCKVIKKNINNNLKIESLSKENQELLNQIDKLKKESKPIIKARDINKCNYKCLDGHMVRSTHEQLIDDYLYNHNIRHCYEKIVIKKSDPNVNITSDWYLPDYDLYIEYWGIENSTKYEEQKKFKQEVYKDYNLLNIYPDDTKYDLNFKLEQELLKYKLKK